MNICRRILHHSDLNLKKKFSFKKERYATICTYVQACGANFSYSKDMRSFFVLFQTLSDRHRDPFKFELSDSLRGLTRQFSNIVQTVTSCCFEDLSCDDYLPNDSEFQILKFQSQIPRMDRQIVVTIIRMLTDNQAIGGFYWEPFRQPIILVSVIGQPARQHFQFRHTIYEWQKRRKFQKPLSSIWLGIWMWIWFLWISFVQNHWTRSYQQKILKKESKRTCELGR